MKYRIEEVRCGDKSSIYVQQKTLWWWDRVMTVCLAGDCDREFHSIEDARRWIAVQNTKAPIEQCRTIYHDT
jgi:hypothetical protein